MTYTPKQPRREVMSFRADPVLLNWVVNQAEKEDITPSDWVRQTLRNLHAKHTKGGNNANDN